jgi:hypothetical protein
LRGRGRASFESARFWLLNQKGSAKCVKRLAGKMA